MNATATIGQRQFVNERKGVHIDAQAIGGTIGGAIGTGLWTWGAVAACSAGGPWIILGVICAFCAASALLVTLSQLFQIVG